MALPYSGRRVWSWYEEVEEQACDTLGNFAESRRNQLRFFAISISWWDRLGPEKTPITKINQVSLHPTPKIAKKAPVEEILLVSRILEVLHILMGLNSWALLKLNTKMNQNVLTP